MSNGNLSHMMNEIIVAAIIIPNKAAALTLMIKSESARYVEYKLLFIDATND